MEFGIEPEPPLYGGCKKGLYGGIAVVVLGVIVVGVMIVLVELDTNKANNNEDTVVGSLHLSCVTSAGGHLSLPLSLPLPFSSFAAHSHSPQSEMNNPQQQHSSLSGDEKSGNTRRWEESERHIHTRYGRKLLNMHGLVGQAPALLVYILSYYVRSIQICQNVSLPLTNTVNTHTKCLTVYTSDLAPDYNTYGYEQALAETMNGRYINLADASSRSTLTRTVSLRKSHLHDYHWGVISWYRPVLVHANIRLSTPNQNLTLYTKLRTAPDISCGQFTTRVSNLTIGTADTSAVLTRNTNIWFSPYNPR